MTTFQIVTSAIGVVIIIGLFEIVKILGSILEAITDRWPAPDDADDPE